MTPGGMLPSPQAGPSPTSAFNSISSAAVPDNSAQDNVQKPQASPVEQLLDRFSTVFNSFRDLTAVPDYAGATDEANDVKKALNAWLSATADKLPSTQSQIQNGGESPQANSAVAPPMQ